MSLFLLGLIIGGSVATILWGALTAWRRQQCWSCLGDDV